MSASPFKVPDLDTHPDGELLRAIAAATAYHDDYDAARRRGEQALRRFILDTCHAAVATDVMIAKTQARTPEGLHAKLTYALGDWTAEDDCRSVFSVPKSAIRDVLRSGRLG